MSHLCKYRKYLKACTTYDLRNKRIQNEQSSCLQGSAGLQSISPTPQPTFPRTTRSLPYASYFLNFWRRFFSSFYHGHSAWIKISGSEATLDFQNHKCNSFHCFSWFCIPRVLLHGTPCFNPLDGITHP